MLTTQFLDWYGERLMRRTFAPRTDGRRKALEAMRAAVKAAGPDHKSYTQSTNTPDPSGFTCIQGEMLGAIGVEKGQRSASSGGVAQAFDPGCTDVALLHALSMAQNMNDDQRPWGLILHRFEMALAA